MLVDDSSLRMALVRKILCTAGCDVPAQVASVEGDGDNICEQAKGLVMARRGHTEDEAYPRCARCPWTADCP